MQAQIATINQIDNGYVVTVMQPMKPGTPPVQPVHQYCADKNAVAQFLISTFVPGATYTAPAAAT